MKKSKLFLISCILLVFSLSYSRRLSKRRRRLNSCPSPYVGIIAGADTKNKEDNEDCFSADKSLHGKVQIDLEEEYGKVCCELAEKKSKGATQGDTQENSQGEAASGDKIANAKSKVTKRSKLKAMSCNKKMKEGFKKDEEMNFLCEKSGVYYSGEFEENGQRITKEMCCGSSSGTKIRRNRKRRSF